MSAITLTVAQYWTAHGQTFPTYAEAKDAMSPREHPTLTMVVEGDLSTASDADLSAKLFAVEEWLGWELYRHCTTATADERRAKSMIRYALKAEIQRRRIEAEVVACEARLVRRAA